MDPSPESPGRERVVRKESASVQIAITCRHGSIPDDLRDTLARKSEKLLTYFERVTAIGVTVIFANEQVNGRIRVEILLDAEHKHNFVATDDGDEVPSTFDRALSKMEQQLKKYKNKIQDHRRGARLSDAVEENPTAEPE
jgi:putative sigma-54 modulation protein